MANETFRTKGAIEPNGAFTSTSNTMFRWKGAIEPTGTVAGRIMSSIAAAGGLAAKGGIAGKGGGLAG